MSSSNGVVRREVAVWCPKCDTTSLVVMHLPRGRLGKVEAAVQPHLDCDLDVDGDVISLEREKSRRRG